LKKVCFFVSKIENSGGTEKSSINLGNHLVKNGYEVFFFNLIGNSNSFFEIDKNIKIYSLNLKNNSTRKNFFKIIFELRNFLKNNKIDILIDVDSILTFFSTFSTIGLSIKHISWEHFNFNIDLGIKFRRIGRWFAAKYCDYIVVLTNKDKNLWKKNLKINSEIINIPNSINSRNSFSKREKIILSIGRPVYVKGYDLLLNIWSNICKSNIDWRLKIIGCDEEYDFLNKKINELGLNNVELVNATKNIDFFYKEASIYCMTSRFEGLPMVLLEAQSYGLPIVAFDCNTGPDEIIINGSNGFLIEINDIDNFCDKLQYLMNNETIYQDMVEKSYKNIKRFDNSVILKEWMKIL